MQLAGRAGAVTAAIRSTVIVAGGFAFRSGARNSGPSVGHAGWLSERAGRLQNV